MMINRNIVFGLPTPWSEKTFQTNKIGAINFLVGPNGSGKSQFARTLKTQLPNCRILSTDRLSGMEAAGAMQAIIGDHFSSGYGKGSFSNIKEAGKQTGLGLDTLILLEERMDLRIQVEATLSHLFNRKISFEWDSGNLIAKSSLGISGKSYRLDREECHGIKELLVLLTHLYNDDHPYLIIDEPELNLHPQYQAFFLQEVRRVAGDPNVDSKKKVVFLITHSPFMLDFQSVQDVMSVISFDSEHSVPRHIFNLNDQEASRLATLIPRLNVHHKQLFFSDNPVFVEGILDAQLIQGILTASGVSSASAGSCIIDAGGNEEVNHYLTLCQAFGKNAFFVYDLDSLFTGNLRACIKGDGVIQSFLASLGLGFDFANYCGQLDSSLTAALDKFLAHSQTPKCLESLKEYLSALGPRTEWQSKTYAKGRVAILTALNLYGIDLISIIGDRDFKNIEGRLNQIRRALEEVKVFLLPRGALELYMPSYTGNRYKIPSEAKGPALKAEFQCIAAGMSNNELQARYEDLFSVVKKLPSKTPVDCDIILKEYMSLYIHDLQGVMLNNHKLSLEDIRIALEKLQKSMTQIITIESVSREEKKFQATLKVNPLLGNSERFVSVSEKTNAGMREFVFLSTAPQ